MFVVILSVLAILLLVFYWAGFSNRVKFWLDFRDAKDWLAFFRGQKICCPKTIMLGRETSKQLKKILFKVGASFSEDSADFQDSLGIKVERWSRSFADISMVVSFWEKGRHVYTAKYTNPSWDRFAFTILDTFYRELRQKRLEDAADELRAARVAQNPELFDAESERIAKDVKAMVSQIT